MTIGARELRQLRRSLFLLALASAIGGTAVVLVVAEMHRKTGAVGEANRQRLHAEARLHQASSEEKELRTRSEIFERMRTRGMVGEERRLEWMELIRDQRTRHRLFEIDYEMSPQQKLGDPAAGYQFRGSLVRLQLPLLHEDDLLRLLDGIGRVAPAQVLPRHCELSRRNPTGQRAGLQPELQADCTLLWVTLSEAADTGSRR